MTIDGVCHVVDSGTARVARYDAERGLQTLAIEDISRAFVSILEAPRGGCVNVHASLLPRWRGAAPIQRAVLAGDETSGVTIMQMDEGLDTGPMLHRLAIDIREKNAGQVTEELANLGAQALFAWLDHPTPPEPQPIAGATYAKKVDKAEARIDWTHSAPEIERQVRAFAPAPGAWFEANGERIKLLEAAVGAEK